MLKGASYQIPLCFNRKRNIMVVAGGGGIDTKYTVLGAPLK